MRRIPPPSPALVVAGLALFFATTGAAFAGGLRIGKNSVGTTQVRNGSLKGADLAKDTVTGNQVAESSLGPVPRAVSAGSASAAVTAATAGTARNADRAGSAGWADRATSASTAANADRAASAANADRVGGRSASSFASSDEVFAVAVRLAYGQTKTLVERDGARLEAMCSVTGSGNVTLTVSVVSTSDGATFEGDGTSRAGGQDGLLGPATAFADRVAMRSAGTVGTPSMKVVRGTVLTSAGGTSIFFGSTAGARLAFGLQGAACSVTAPVMITVL